MASLPVQPREGQLYVQPYTDGRWEEVHVKLTKESFLVLRRDVVYEDTMANNVSPSSHPLLQPATLSPPLPSLQDLIEATETTLHRDKESRLGLVIMVCDCLARIPLHCIII